MKHLCKYLIIVGSLFLVDHAFSQPTNDSICNAIAISPNGTVNCYSTAGSGLEASDPSHSCGGTTISTWFKFQAPSSGSVTISTDNAGTNFNTVLALFSASSCSGSFTELGCNDDGNEDVVSNSSDLVVNCLEPFTTYYLLVDGVAGATGDVCISITNNGGTIGTDNSCSAPLLTIDGSVTCFSNFCATAQNGEPTGSTWSDGVDNSIWVAFVAPASRHVFITTDNAGTTLNNQIAVYSNGCPISFANEIQSDEGSGSAAGTSEMLVCGLNAGNIYWLQIDGVAADTGQVCVSLSNLSMNNLSPGPDNICSASSLPVDGSVSSHHNICATTQLGEPAGANWLGLDTADNSTWHTFIAPASGRAIVSTDDGVTNFDTQIAVYRSSDGTCNGTLTEVGSDDNSGSGTASLLDLACLQPGTVYLIQVDGQGGASGDYGISISSNQGPGLGADMPCSAINLNILNDSMFVFTNSCADTSMNEPVPPVGTSCSSLDGWCGSEPPSIQHTIWFSFSPSSPGFITISSDNDSTGFDTQLALWESGDCADFNTYNLVAANDNCPGGCTSGNALASVLSACVDTGANYFLQVDGYGGATGKVGLEVSFQPVLDFVQEDTISACPGDTINVLAMGGVSYLWNTGDTTSLIAVNPEGDSTFVVTVTDSNGCVNADKVSFIADSLPNALAQPDTGICIGNEVSLTASGGFAYQWSNGQSSNSITVLPQSDTVYQVTVTGVNGCTAADSVSIIVHELPIPDAGNDTAICFGDSALLSAAGGVEFLWNTGDTTSSIHVSPDMDSLYSVKVTDLNGCMDLDSVVVVINPLPLPVIEKDTAVCAGNEVSLTVTGGASYLWNTGATGDSIRVSPPSTTLYTVGVTDSNGCVGSDSALVTIFTPANPSLGNDTAICAGAGITLAASGGIDYTWSTGATSSSILVSPISTKDFSVTMIDSNGCAADDTVTVSVNPSPSAGLSDTVICPEISVALDAGNPGSSYVWSTGSTDRVISVSQPDDYVVTITNTSDCSIVDTASVANYHTTPPTLSDAFLCVGDSVTLNAGSGGVSYHWSAGQTDSSITVTMQGAYSVTVIDSNDCVLADTSNVITFSLPVVDAGEDDSVCLGEAITLTASGGTEYSWSTGDSSSSIVVQPTSANTYFVTATDTNGCTASDSIKVVVLSNPSISLADTIVCPGDPVMLDAGIANTNYYWSTSDTTQVIVVTVPDAYSVMVTDLNGCTATDTATVSNFQTQPLELTDQTGCEGDTVLLDAGSVFVSYSWSTGEISQTITVDSAGTYVITATDSNGCSVVDSALVEINPLPQADAGTDVSICEGASTTLNASGGTTYFWSTGQASITISVNPSTTTIYNVTVTSADNCSDADSVQVIVNPPPTVTLSGLDSMYCLDDGAVTLIGGTPAGGVYSGDGVSGSMFNPSSAGEGTHHISYHYTDANGCIDSASVTVMVDQCPGIRNLYDKASFLISPNPFDSKLNIDIMLSHQEKVGLKLFNILGEVVMMDEVILQRGSNEIQLNTPGNLSEGLYLLEIGIREGHYTFKIVKN